MKRAPILWLLAAAACARQEPAKTAVNPEISRAIAALGPAVVEASAPLSPEWVLRTANKKDGALTFVGQSNAPTLDGAKTRAERDLLAAISSYVSVDVEADMDDVSWSNNGREGQSIKSTVKTKTSAALREIQPDAYYWERIASSPLAVDSANYQYYLRASVSRGEIARARLAKQTTRRSETGRKIIALLPFRGVGTASIAADLVARGLYEETGRMLGRAAQVHLVEESVVKAVISGAAREEEASERAFGALLPEKLVRANVQLHRGRVRVSLRMEDAAGRVEELVRTRAVSELAELSSDLAQGILRSLGSKLEIDVSVGQPVAREVEDGARKNYVEAGIKLQSGALEEALSAIKKTIAIAPTHAAAHLRMGRILERMGRFAKIPPTASAAYGQEYLSLCGPEAVEAEQRAIQAMGQRVAQLSSGTGAPSWWTADAPFVDQVLGLVLDILEGQQPPAARVGIQAHTFDDPPEWLGLKKQRAEAELAAPKNASSALEAYAAAMELFIRQRDKRGELEAKLAIADLASRVDRLDYALFIYRAVSNSAAAERDPHYLSLAHYGRAMVHRKRGYFGAARSELIQALYARAQLGEKPYILEIYNELGSVALSLAEYDAAEALYRHALRIAEEMSSDYLRAVLGNNLGAVEWSRGQSGDAADRFQRAADKLTDLRESEGRISATLNLAAAFDLRAELDQAELLHAEIDRLVKQTQQERWMAELSLHRGAFELHRGNSAAGLEGLAGSFHLYQRIGSRAEARRARDALYAGEYYSKVQDRSLILRCMKTRYWGLDAAVFEPEDVIDGWSEPSPNPLATANLPLRELIFALDAAAVLALDSWTPDYDRTVVFTEPSSTAPAEIDPRAQQKAQREAEKRRTQIELDSMDRDVRESRPEPTSKADVMVEITTGAATSDSEESFAAEPARQKVQVAKAVDYERILGAFTVDADVVLLLDAATVEQFAVTRLLPSARRAFAALKTAFERRGAKRLVAACELNDGALAWAQGDAEAAYQGFVAAERAFAAAGENRGLAHAHAWLAHAFEASGALEIAAEHRAVADHLFSRIAPR